MQIKKTLAVILAAIMCATAFVACDSTNDKDDNKDTGTKDPQTTQSSASDKESEKETGKKDETSTEDTRFDYFEADLSEYLSVDKSLYTDIDVTVSADLKVDEEMLETYIDSLRYKHRAKANGDTKINAAPIKFGDSAFIYYKGFKDGEEFEGGSNWSDASPYELGIGSSSFIPGFEDGLIGVIPSETSKESPYELHVTFPENYQATDLAGKAVVFQVYVEYIIQYDLPEYNEKFITETLAYKPETDSIVDEYNKYCWDLLLADSEYYAKQEALNNVWEDLLEKATVIKYPEGEVEYYYNSYIEQYKYYMQMFNTYYGYSFKSLDEFVPEYLGLADGVDWDEETRVTAELDTKQNMVFHAIAQQEGIYITQTDYNNSIQFYIDYYKEYYGTTYSASDIEANIGARLIKENALFEKINDFLYSKCKVSYGE